MIPGLPNAYFAMPLYKMEIYYATLNTATNEYSEDMSECFSVLFNPQSYTMSRSSMPEKDEEDAQSAQPFPATSPLETLEVDFFIDTFSAALEVVGLNGGVSALDALKFTGNSELPSAAKQLSAMDYANKFYDLCLPESKEHRPPDLVLKWKDSLFFPCYMQSCSVEYTKFKETGVPVRAKVHCTFVGIQPLQKVDPSEPPESPDTAKFHQVKQGETLNDLAEIAYKKPARWREVAVANGIVNPRILNSGDVLRMPAL